MKKRLNGRETLLIATMLFGMFFGAGNLIFPAYLGRQAGSAVWPAKEIGSTSVRPPVIP